MSATKYDLSICLPGYRKNNWIRLYDSIYDSCKKHSWELILVGPYFKDQVCYELPIENNFTYKFDRGSPARCGQIATTLAQGQYLTWGSDDGYFLENSLDEALDLIKSVGENDIVAMRYREGSDYQGVEEPEQWFTGRYHADQRLDGVLPHWRIAPVGMYRLEFFKWIGGFDCGYEHLNMSTHDLAYRSQKNGSTVHLSPSIISTHDWNVNCESWRPMSEAYHLNDLPLFQKQYHAYNPDRICIDYNNWKNAPEVWGRRKI